MNKKLVAIFVISTGMIWLCSGKFSKHLNLSRFQEYSTTEMATTFELPNSKTKQLNEVLDSDWEEFLVRIALWAEALEDSVLIGAVSGDQEQFKTLNELMLRNQIPYSVIGSALLDLKVPRKDEFRTVSLLRDAKLFFRQSVDSRKRLECVASTPSMGR